MSPTTNIEKISCSHKCPVMYVFMYMYVLCMYVYMLLWIPPSLQIPSVNDPPATPNRGPQSGGTNITIRGRYLGIGSSHNVTVASHECKIHEIMWDDELDQSRYAFNLIIVEIMLLSWLTHTYTHTHSPLTHTTGQTASCVRRHLMAWCPTVSSPSPLTTGWGAELGLLTSSTPHSPASHLAYPSSGQLQCSVCICTWHDTLAHLPEVTCRYFTSLVTCTHSEL